MSDEKKIEESTPEKRKTMVRAVTLPRATEYPTKAEADAFAQRVEDTIEEMRSKGYSFERIDQFPWGVLLYGERKPDLFEMLKEKVAAGQVQVLDLSGKTKAAEGAPTPHPRGPIPVNGNQAVKLILEVVQETERLTSVPIYLNADMLHTMCQHWPIGICVEAADVANGAIEAHITHHPDPDCKNLKNLTVLRDYMKSRQDQVS